MKAKIRNRESMSSKNGATRRFYLSNQTYDNLIKEAAEKDISVSALLRGKLELVDKITFLVLKNNLWSDKENKN